MPEGTPEETSEKTQKMPEKKKIIIGVAAGLVLALLRAVRSLPDVSFDGEFVVGFLFVSALFIVVSTLVAYFSSETTFPKIFKESLLAPSIVAALIPGAGGDDVSSSIPVDSPLTQVEEVTGGQSSASLWDFIVTTAQAQPSPAPVSNRPVKVIKKGDYEASGFDRAKQLLGLSYRPNSWTYKVYEAGDSVGAARVADGIAKIPGINAEDVRLIRPRGQNVTYVTLKAFNIDQAPAVGNYYHAYAVRDTARVRTDSTLQTDLELLHNGNVIDLRNLTPR